MRYFIGFLVALGLIILIIVLLINGGGKSKAPSTSRKLTSYATTDAQVSMTIDGPVNAVSLHQQVRITVDRDDVTYQQITGYDGEVVNTRIFANTQSAYNVFLNALARAGFTSGNNNPDLRNELGRCPLGSRYIFELNQDDKNLQRYWSTSCGGIKTYLGSTSLTLTLFKAQVPGYQSLTSGLVL